MRTAEYDKMICNELLAAFSKRTTNSTMKQYEAVTIQVNGSESIFDDVITYVAAIATVSHDVGEIEADGTLQVIDALNDGLSKIVPALGLAMRTATKGKDYSVDQWCEILVEKASQRRQPMSLLTGRRASRRASRCLMQSA